MRLGTWGSYGIEKLKILPGEGWEGLTITATFVTPTTSTRMLVPEDGIVTVPPEATANVFTAGVPARIVFSGVADGIQRITTDLPYRVSDHAPIEGDAPTPTPSEWEQFVAQVQGAASDAKKSATEAADSAKQAKDAAASVSGAVEAVESAETKALQDIDTAKTGAVQGVQEAQESGVLAVQDAEHKAVGAVNDTADMRQQELGDIASHPPVPNLETGKWQVWDAESGAYVDTEAEYQGETGPRGPVYTLTESDKQTIVQAVLNALPVYNGEVQTVG